MNNYILSNFEDDDYDDYEELEELEELEDKYKEEKPKKPRKKYYIPTGRPRGRPVNPNKPGRKPYIPTGRPRGRPVNPNKPGRKPYIPTGRPRGRPQLPIELKKPRTYSRIPIHLHRKSGRPRVMLDFYEAKSLILDEMIGSVKQYRQWYKFNRPAKLPYNPYETYRDQWTDWNDFLGNENQNFEEIKKKGKRYIDLESATTFARKQKFKKMEEWLAFTKDEKFPNNIPKRPDMYYRKDWISWKVFLGYDNMARIEKEIIDGKKYIFIAKYNNSPRNVYKIDITLVKPEKIKDYAKIQQFKILKLYEYDETFSIDNIVNKHGNAYWSGERGDYEINNIYELIMEFDYLLMSIRV